MDDNAVPRHVAVIPDGNRRFAKKHGKHSSQGHRQGGENFRGLLEWCREFGVGELSFWALSTENLKRDETEVKFLFSLFGEMCDEIINKHGKDEKLSEVRICFCGALTHVPQWLQQKMKHVEELTKSNSKFRLNLLIAYGGREEILHVVREIANDAASGRLIPQDLSDDSIRKRLYVQSEPDLIIRTGHACLSGLLPWQSSYSEIIFLEDKFWPEFTKDDFRKCLDEFSSRKRNFGR